jgi:hypothetical protein
VTVGASYKAKQLRVTLVLAGSGSVFPGTNSDTLVLTDLRVTAVVQAVARLATQADISIYGMLRADMDALTVAWANPPIVRDHIVILEANSGDGWTQVFKGTILEAQPDYASAPDVSFRLQAITGYFQKINPAPPTSYAEAVDIGAIVMDLAEKMGFTYQDGGADGVLSSPYFAGSYFDQLQQACQAAGADFYIQGDTILVTPQGLPRKQQPALVLNAGSGLIGYPSYERAGLSVVALFNPAILCGSPLEIESIVPSATGRWYPYSTEHLLESRMPEGAWFSKMFCLRVLGEDAATP